MNSYKLTIAILISFIYSGISAQVTFTDRSAWLSGDNNHSGVAMGIIDMNGDGLDDVVRLNDAKHLNFQLQSQNSQAFDALVGPTTSNNGQWSMCMADIDNNGTNEVMVGGRYNYVKIFGYNQEDGSFESQSLPGSDAVFVQGSNFADIDNDGFVDAFICHDDGASRIWSNNGDGSFSEADDWIDLSVDGSTGEAASGNYGSVWADIDNDGDLDLYIAKCRQGVFDTTDKRRINQLYINDGEGNFTEDAEARGLDVEWQSWTAEFQDINNDGWLDCFVTNHDYRSQLFLNNGDGYFTELEMVELDVIGLAIQGLMRDVDNDGWVDIITTGSRGQIFMNNGDLTFTEVDFVFDGDNMESLAMGDLNGDGYLDAYAGYAQIFNNPSLVPDKLWINDGGDNNYLSLTLEGVQSNRNAIGARIQIFGPWGIQSREIRAGESYGIANSNVSYFGLGTETEIDSMTIYWPSGLVQTEYDVVANSRIKIVEGSCLAQSPQITMTGTTIFCPGDSLVLTAESGFASYVWSDGSTEETLVVKSTGNYVVEVVDSDGCKGFSQNITVSVDPELMPEISSGDVFEFCEGESVTIELEGVDVDESLISWSDEGSGYSTEVNSSGSYHAIVQGLCREFQSNVIDITVYEYPSAPDAKGDTIVAGEVAILSTSAEKATWFDLPEDGNAIGFGPSIEISGLNEDATFYVEDRSGSGSAGKVGMADHQGSPYSENPHRNDGVSFEVLKPMVIDSVKVYTDLEGIREIIVLDDFNKILASKLVFIEEGETTIHLGFELTQTGNCVLTTGQFQNWSTVGAGGPRLQRSNDEVDYPYSFGDLVTINGSIFSQEFYYYFYDWSVSAGVSCPSERTEVQVVVHPVSTNDIQLEIPAIYPNPSDGRITIDVPEEYRKNALYHIFNMEGRRVASGTLTRQESIELDLQLNSGLYMIEISEGRHSTRQKIIIK